jgi:hypothetical protein
MRKFVHYAVMGSGEITPTVRAGWYPDSDPTQLRWWDGSEWSTLTRQADESPRVLRGGRLDLAARTLMVAGCTLNLASLPKLGGAGRGGHVPAWALIASDVGLGAMALGVVTVIAGAIVGPRAKGPRSTSSL